MRPALSLPAISLPVLLGAGAVLALAAIGYLAARKLGQAFPDDLDLVNPLSSKNVVYQGVNQVGVKLTGDEHFTVGVAAFDVIDALKTPFWFLNWFLRQEPDLTAPTVIAPRRPASAPWPAPEQSPFGFGA